MLWTFTMFFFFFQAEDGIRDVAVTGVQTCALPISAAHEPFVGFARYEDADYFDRTVALCLDAGFTPSIRHEAGQFVNVLALVACGLGVEIGRASCRERV